MTHTTALEVICSRKVKYTPVCGVYFLFIGDDLIYIGQSLDVLARLRSHCTASPFEFDSYYVEECSAEQLKALEAVYINKYVPRHNTYIPGRKDASMMGKRTRKKYGLLIGAG